MQRRDVLTAEASRPFYNYIHRALADIVCGFSSLGRNSQAVMSARNATPKSGLTSVVVLLKFPTGDVDRIMLKVKSIKDVLLKHVRHGQDFKWRDYIFPHTPPAILPQGPVVPATVASPARARLRTGVDSHREMEGDRSYTPRRRDVVPVCEERRVPAQAAGRQAPAVAALGAFFSNAADVLAPALRNKYANDFYKVGVAFERRSVPPNKTRLFLQWPDRDITTQLDFLKEMRQTDHPVWVVNHASIWAKREGNLRCPGFIPDNLFCDRNGNPVGA